MLVRDVMSTEFELASTQTTIKEAAELMASGDFGYLPVGDQHRLIGALTDRDIVVRGLAKGYAPEDTIEPIMSEILIYCLERDTIAVAAELMQAHQIRRLAVVDADNRLSGIITLGDIARSTQDVELTGGTEAQIAQPA